MKKIIAIPLLVLYITAISGMMVQFHFCGNKLSSWKFNETKASCCCAPDKGTDNKNTDKNDSGDDCCKDKTITLKIQQEQNIAHQAQVHFATIQIAILPKINTFVVATPVLKDFTNSSYQANAPPGRWQDIPLYKLHTRFTYYG